MTATLTRSDEDELPEARLLIVGPLEAGEDGATAGPVTIDERLTVERINGSLDLEGACAAAPLTSEDVAAAVATVSTEIRACYERKLREQPGLRGALEVEIRVQPDGTFSGVHVTEDRLGSEAVADCVVAVLETARSQRGSPSGPALFTWPFAFEP